MVSSSLLLEFHFQVHQRTHAGTARARPVHPSFMEEMTTHLSNPYTTPEKITIEPDKHRDKLE
jgi:hypothetical protein